ncbi:hypothetical protein EVA_10283 [gut metagenome]|uniref:Uncharacterized protein n=1 Tax=gut metagenome TaxID=749906 RepID=J9G345_9ZZZZ
MTCCNFSGECTAQSKTTSLARHFLRIAARLGTKSSTAANPYRRTVRTAASAASAFLFPRFTTTAANHGTGFSCGSTLTLVSQLHNNCLVYNSFVELSAKYVFI